MNPDLSTQEREAIWKYLINSLEDYYKNTSALRVSPELDRDKILAYVSTYNFQNDLPLREVIEFVIEGLKIFTVHTPHPAYFGLFNPRANFPGIIADLISAVFNPQMAAWSHAPFANEVENNLIRVFGKKFGYRENLVDGVFTSGGAEANLTALLCALNQQFPEFANQGLIQMKKRPLLYTTEQAHHSIIKAARTTGLGLHSVRIIPTDKKLRLSPKHLREQIEKDLKDGFAPFMVVATAGTTGAGSFDPIAEIAEIAQDYNLWFHVDAAYGGAVIFDEDLQGLLDGVEKSHSITFDAHKWLSVPMATSLFITREREILSQTFRIEADYMPKEAGHIQIKDPFTHSIQWSRRFIGLKLFMAMLTFGWTGYQEIIKHQTSVGNLLKKLLIESGWRIYNDSPLPIVCFGMEKQEKNPQFALNICEKIVKSGKAWLSVYKIGEINTLRACITNYNTNENEIRLLVNLLNEYYQGSYG